MIEYEEKERVLMDVNQEEKERWEAAAGWSTRRFSHEVEAAIRSWCRTGEDPAGLVPFDYKQKYAADLAERAARYRPVRGKFVGWRRR